MSCLNTKPFHLNQLFVSDKLNKQRYNVNLFWVNEYDSSHFLCTKCTNGWIRFADNYVSTTISVGKYFYLTKVFFSVPAHMTPMCVLIIEVCGGRSRISNISTVYWTFIFKVFWKKNNGAIVNERWSNLTSGLTLTGYHLGHWLS